MKKEVEHSKCEIDLEAIKSALTHDKFVTIVLAFDISIAPVNIMT